MPVIQPCVSVCVSVCALFTPTVPFFDFWRKLRCTPTFFVVFFFKLQGLQVCVNLVKPIRFITLLLWRTEFWQTKLCPFFNVLHNSDPAVKPLTELHWPWLRYNIPVVHPGSLYSCPIKGACVWYVKVSVYLVCKCQVSESCRVVRWTNLTHKSNLWHCTGVYFPSEWERVHRQQFDRLFLLTWT